MKNLILSLTTAAALAASFALTSTARASAPSVVAPVPIHAVHPTNILWRYDNMTVTVDMTIDAKGVPHALSLEGSVPDDLAARVLPAMAQWRFTPCYRDGKAVTTRVEFPIRIVSGDLAQAPTPDRAALVARR